ncbi:stromal cell-derived factor 2-like [Dysidea avara]|uniref:stromal cell-derived factor 2-like n=1 Tax=Dysidea avara TaxID=196820 RepID=UPI003334854B
MDRYRFSLVCIITILLTSQHLSVNASGFQFVTCGTVLKLTHVDTNIRLHSHDVKYGSGSGQQSVTGVTHADDVNSYWVVKAQHKGQCTRGEPIKCGDNIRLQHLQTRVFLHSHYFQSPLSNNQEVSCFGDGRDSKDSGDDGDNWQVECSTDNWRRDDPIRFKHSATQKYLHCTGHTYGRPIAGQREISGYPSPTRQNLWKAMEGIYLKPEKH